MIDIMYNKMSRNARLGLLIFIDIVTVVICLTSAFILRFDLSIPSAYVHFVLSWLPVFILIKLISFCQWALQNTPVVGTSKYTTRFLLKLV